MNRRGFLQAAGTLGLALALPPGVARARSAPAAGAGESSSADGFGVLTDLTHCIGCRKCEWACNAANGLPTASLASFEDKSVFAERRRPDASRYTVVNEAPPREAGGRPVRVKVQCMHCNDPACASACLVSAFTKTPEGPVVYDASRCMGCRYCMMACPFQIPAYEYDRPLTPRVLKCTLCDGRLAEGKPPACVEICPPQCLVFGRRSELLALAHRRIAEHPDRYVNHVYGEEEAGGTAWLYLGDRPFSEFGLPELPAKSPARITQSLQHSLFKNFVPPVALYAFLGAIHWIYRPERAEAGRPPDAPPHPAADPAGEHEAPARVRHTMRTRGVAALAALAAVGFLFAAARFLLGLGRTTNLTDQYPWGIWIAVDVASGVALAAGGFTTAALVHVFHRERYHALMRPALLSAMLGYTFVALGLLVDLGRYYNIWHPMMPSMWSGHSVLFEVAMCVMAYLTVLYLEFAPAAIERWRGRVNLRGAPAGWNRAVERALARADRGFGRIMLFLILAGVVLSCLHQSSLGSLLLIAPSKMHPLWYTPILPLLFLLSAICAGYPVVIFESLASARALGRPPETALLARLARATPVLLALYGAFKLGDLVVRDAWVHLLRADWAAAAFAFEFLAGIVAPFLLLASPRIRGTARGLFAASVLVIVGVLANRLNVFLVAYHPPYATGSYLPSIGEIAVTVGLFATLFLAYRWMVTQFPILPGAEREREAA